jgi:hypothetical protein
LRLCRFLARCFRYLCLRIFLRRFLMTLPIGPSASFSGAAVVGGGDQARADGIRGQGDVKRSAQGLRTCRALA